MYKNILKKKKKKHVSFLVMKIVLDLKNIVICGLNWWMQFKIKICYIKLVYNTNMNTTVTYSNTF